MFEFQSVLFLDYKKRSERKILYSSTKLTASNSDI